jgi:hypothetical protein
MAGRDSKGWCQEGSLAEGNAKPDRDKKCPFSIQSIVAARLEKVLLRRVAPDATFRNVWNYRQQGTIVYWNFSPQCGNCAE